jgi:t-SNARE complex subunit (syntaxin)
VEEGSSGQGRTQLLLQEEQNLEEIRERELAIRQLESDIVDVNTIFKDLATLVHDQVSISCIYNYLQH